MRLYATCRESNLQGEQHVARPLRPGIFQLATALVYTAAVKQERPPAPGPHQTTHAAGNARQAVKKEHASLTLQRNIQDKL